MARFCVLVTKNSVCSPRSWGRIEELGLESPFSFFLYWLKEQDREPRLRSSAVGENPACPVPSLEGTTSQLQPAPS